LPLPSTVTDHVPPPHPKQNQYVPAHLHPREKSPLASVVNDTVPSGPPHLTPEQLAKFVFRITVLPQLFGQAVEVDASLAVKIITAEMIAAIAKERISVLLI
jgi:hypothetical protein